MAIHGNKSQNARVKALQDFKENRITALVATEVAARGLDIKELPHVVNYELPNVPEDYVHRIGRTARAGSTGAADLAGIAGRAQLPARHREAAQAQDRFRRAAEVRDQGRHASAARRQREPANTSRTRIRVAGPNIGVRISGGPRNGQGGGRQGGRQGGGGRSAPGRASHDSYVPARSRPRSPRASARPIRTARASVLAGSLVRRVASPAHRVVGTTVANAARNVAAMGVKERAAAREAAAASAAASRAARAPVVDGGRWRFGRRTVRRLLAHHLSARKCPRGLTDRAGARLSKYPRMVYCRGVSVSGGGVVAGSSVGEGVPIAECGLVEPLPLLLAFHSALSR